jgi:hypothetical protein
MNVLIRRAAGHGGYVPVSQRGEAAERVGDIGVGRGGACSPQPMRPDTAVRMNAAIREAAQIATHRIDSDGVSLDDLWWR